MSRCEISGKEFEYSDKEKSFISGLSFKFAGKTFSVPLLNLSPDERMRERTAYRNEQYMYRNFSAIDNKPLVSIFSSDKGLKIYPQSFWFSDNWDPLAYGVSFDSSKSFFEQFADLSKKVPKANMVTVDNDNCEYTTGTGYCKNCYLINSSEYCEDCYYGKLLQTCKNIVDSSYVYDSEICYQCFNVRKCYNTKYVYNSQNCSDCSFADNLTGCRNCFLCTNLNNQEYCFLNQRMDKDSYEQKVKEFEGYDGISRALDMFSDLRKKRIYKYANVVNSQNCSGDFIRNSKECFNSYDMTDGQDCEHVQVGVGCKDVYDCSNMYVNPEIAYQVLGVIETFNVHFCLYVFNSSDLLYCENMYSCKNCFGCSGLRNKQYCILNKQYTKEEYEQIVATIIEHMQQVGEWGRFFPSKYSPFSYNESVANSYLPLTTDEALQRGFKWKDDMDEVKESLDSIQAENLPKTIQEVGDDILRKTILCEKTKRAYRIVEQELKFYRLHNLPLPRRHPDVRHMERMTLRNKRRLFERSCMKCQKPVMTTYSSDRPETIYCEECYLTEIF